ncbi:MAG: hypothetical protein OEM59_19340, partial [Rhodospirillales bacterium]|nr:hypothetical protein [Rhodospirillales bacterium]
SATLSDGSHTVTASVTDGDGAPGSDSVTITVGSEPPPPPPSGTISVGNIELYAKGPHVNMTVTIVESGTANPATDVGVTSVLLTHDTNNSGTFDAVCDLDNAGGNTGVDDCWDFQPLTTDSNGQTNYKLLHAPGGAYQFEVLGLSGPVPWDSLQDANNPAYGSF